MGGRSLYRNAEESEKVIESHLCRLTREAGGLALKYTSATQTGYPDRLLLFPGGKTVWVEVKSKGLYPTPLQCLRIRRLREVGQRVEICDSRQRAEEIVNSATESEPEPKPEPEPKKEPEKEEKESILSDDFIGWGDLDF